MILLSFAWSPAFSVFRSNSRRRRKGSWYINALCRTKPQTLSLKTHCQFYEIFFPNHLLLRKQISWYRGNRILRKMLTVETWLMKFQRTKQILLGTRLQTTLVLVWQIELHCGRIQEFVWGWIKKSCIWWKMSRLFLFCLVFRLCPVHPSLILSRSIVRD